MSELISAATDSRETEFEVLLKHIDKTKQTIIEAIDEAKQRQKQEMRAICRREITMVLMDIIRTIKLNPCNGNDYLMHKLLSNLESDLRNLKY